jgi:hypothetical protein
VTEFFAVWTPGSVITALVGGLLMGFLLVSRFDNPRFDALESIGVILILGIFAGLTFWSGQIVDTYATSGPAFGWRVVSRFGLFVLFVLALGAGTGLGVRFRRGSWR